jgi:hypothetical protein
LTAQAGSVRVRLKAIAIPNEHGGWGFTSEPVLLGLLVAPSWAGLGLGILALAAFLTRHPLKLWLGALRKGTHYPRTRFARDFALLYGTLGLAGLLLTALTARGEFWLPLLLALPLIGLQLWFDARGQGRELLPEIAGAAAMGAMAAAIALAAGSSLQLAAGLWLVLAMRSAAAIYYARAQVRRARGERVEAAPAYWVELLAVAGLAAGAWVDLVPWLSVGALATLVPLSVYTFNRPPAPARVVGWTQIGMGLLIVAATAVGVRLGW